VRYSRALTSAFLGRVGVTFRFKWLVIRFSAPVLSYESMLPLQLLSVKYPIYGKSLSGWVDSPRRQTRLRSAFTLGILLTSSNL
jgi:hypothetical protein